MTSMSLLMIAAGLGLLGAGGEILVRGASRLAEAAGISRLVIGLTIVSFGTSAPEMLVSVYASFTGNPEIAIANVVGSNIINVLLILGSCAVIRPMIVASRLIRIDVPVMIAASVLVLVLSIDGNLGFWDGLLLFGGAILYVLFILKKGTRDEVLNQQARGLAGSRSHPGPGTWGLNLVLIIAGLGLLVLGARWLVEGASALARAFGVSDVIIGLTIVAGGTSLPEVAASVVATMRGERDIAIGNVIGSNIFNILGILGLSSLLGAPRLSVSASLVDFDLPFMVAVAIACLPLFFTGRELNRWEGLVFLGYYIAYITYLILASSHHEALPLFSKTMIGFIAPITALTILVAAVREWRSRRRKSVT